MKNKVTIDILERLMYEIEHNGYIEQSYIVYVKGVIEGLKQDNTTFDIPNSSIDPNDWIIYTNTGEQ